MTYIQESLNNGRIKRWDLSDFPLPVYIEPCNWKAATCDTSQYNQLVIRAFKEWETRSNGLVSFRFVSNLMDSKVNLSWKWADRQSLGFCKFNSDTPRLYSAEMEIGIANGIIHNEYQKEDEVYHTILHEIGHAIGLGHSKDKKDIMYTPHQYGITKISNNDIKTLEYIYALPIGLGIKQMSEQLGIYLNNFDDIIAKIEQKYVDENTYYEERKPKKSSSSRSLSEENERLAELKKYTMTIHNLNVKVDPFFKKPKYNERKKK